MGAQASATMGPTLRVRPRPRPVLDASVPRVRPRATPDAAVAKIPDAAIPKRPVATPDAAVVSTGPPKQTGPAPALVVVFDKRSTRTPKKMRQAIRKLVKAHGYKDVQYKLTGYGAERRKPKYNRALARRRCRKIARLIRKRGVSRRWIDCAPPVFRKEKRKATEADKVPAWRRVEIRVVKP